MKTTALIASLALPFIAAPLSQAALVAFDNASQAVYDDNWVTGDNGGSGFGAWTLVSGTGQAQFPGFFIEDDKPASDIDTGTPGNAFGLYDFGDTSVATAALRPFTGDLSVGQSFLLDFDNGGVGSGNRVGFQLRDGSDVARFEFSFLGGGATYDVIGATTQNTAATFTNGGMSTIFTLTGVDTFSFTIDYNNAAADETFTGTLGGTAGTGLAGLRAFNDVIGGSNEDMFINSLAIVVPEPGSLALATLGGLAMVIRRRN